MVNLNLNIGNIFSKKNINIFILIFFLILNIADFFNFLEGDLDFFEKITSWYAIAYIFYHVSFTRISIGQRIKSYDILFILTFCLFTIPQSLGMYLLSVGDSLLGFSGYFFFNFLKNISISLEFLALNFILACLLIIILSIALLMNHNVRKKSFLGSFNFKDKYFSYFFRKIVLIFFGFFFGIILFNLFMEWFALAVDDIILMIGMIYYIFLYLHKHTKININFLEKVSNSGNDFLENLIKVFSNKNTFFIGISFLLTILLVVDAGVFLVPYSTGVENDFYFGQLNTNTYISDGNRVNTMHYPLFFTSGEGFFKDYNDRVISGDWFLISVVIFIYLLSLFLGFSLLVLPFFIFFKNIQKRHFELNKFFIIFLVSSLFFCIFFKLFILDLNFPLNISEITMGKARGVDIHTLNIIGDTAKNIDFNLMISFVIYIISFMFVYFRYEKYQFFFEKFLYIFILLFFIYYIVLFYQSTITVESNTLRDEISLNMKESYNLLDINYGNTNLMRSYNEKIYGNLLNLSTFSINTQYGQKDFIRGNFISFNNNSFYFGNLNNLYLEDKYFYDFELNRFASSDVIFYYYIGDNILDNSLDVHKKLSSNVILVHLTDSRVNDLNINELYVKKVYSSKKILIIFSVFVKIILISVFYVFGLIAFVIFYLRRNIFNHS